MPKKLLIIEDDPAIQQILYYIFTKEGYEVELSLNGEVAGELAVMMPDLILMDLQLKDAKENGDAICRYLKSQPATRSIPVLLLSAERELARSATPVVQMLAFPNLLMLRNLPG